MNNKDITGNNYLIRSVDNGNGKDNSFLLPLYARRITYPVIPARSNYRSAQSTVKIQTLNNGQEVAVLKEPYTRVQKTKFEDAATNDAMVRRCLNLIVRFLLGKRTKNVVDINKEFLSQEHTQQALSFAFSQQEVNDLKSLVDKVGRKVKFHQKINTAVLQSQVGGRSALVVETSTNAEETFGIKGLPVDLKVTNWQRLGNVYADPTNWKMIAVEYGDRPREEPLMADEIVYFANEDNNVAADTLYQGRSSVEPVADAAETIRYIVAEDLKEASKMLWAKSGMLMLPPNIDPVKAAEIIAGFMPGVWNSTSQTVDIKTFDLDPKLEALSNVVMEMQRYIYRSFGVPGPLVGFEQITNRATMDLVLNGWRESDLNEKRTWLQDTLEPQWFDSLITLRFPELNPEDMAIKIKLEFEDVTFETLKDRADAVLPLFQAGIMPLEKVLKILDMEDVLEEVMAQQKDIEAQRQAELERLRAQGQGGGQFGPGNQPGQTNPLDNMSKSDSNDRKNRRQRDKAVAAASFSANIVDVDDYIIKQSDQEQSEEENDPEKKDPVDEDKRPKRPPQPDDDGHGFKLRQASLDEANLKLQYMKEEHEQKMKALDRLQKKIDEFES